MRCTSSAALVPFDCRGAACSFISPYSSCLAFLSSPFFLPPRLPPHPPLRARARPPCFLRRSRSSPRWASSWLLRRRLRLLRPLPRAPPRRPVPRALAPGAAPPGQGALPALLCPARALKALSSVPARFSPVQEQENHTSYHQLCFPRSEGVRSPHGCPRVDLFVCFPHGRAFVFFT